MFRSPVTPLEVAGKSVIMTRDTAGAVHVFHNYCRHRGLKILTGAVRRALVERFQSFNVEDIAIVEGLQDAFATTAFDGGHLSPAFDANIHHFHRLIAEHTRTQDPTSAGESRCDRTDRRPA